MSTMLHIAYDDPTFMHPRDPASYDMGLALDMKSSSLMAQQYMLDNMMHPLASLPPSHSVPYDMRAPFEPSHYHHMDAIPFDLPHAHDVHHPTPIRPTVASSTWSHLSGQPQFVEQPQSSFPPSSISQPSIFIEPSSKNPSSRVTKVVPQAVDPAAPPPPPWTMSGSLDPTTGVYQIAPEHPRIRTAQACEKCRSRKAKCSGEHPVCQRCQTRGLKCEYAPERKMRGPNKFKRKDDSSESKASRRTSLASASSSTSGTSDASDSNSKSGSPVLTEPQQFMMTLNLSTPTKSQTSVSPSPLSGSPALEPAHLSQQRRPSHIDLSGTKMYEQMLPPSFVPHSATFGLGADDSASGSAAWRRASLPSYLMETYTNQFVHRSPSLGSVYTPPRGIDVVDTTIARPHSNPAYTHDALSLFPPSVDAEGSVGGSSSGASMSTPLTPLTHPSDPSDLAYPLDFHHEPLDFVSLDAHLNEDAWIAHDGGEMDVDVTPRVAEDGHEKSLAQVESELFHD